MDWDDLRYVLAVGRAGSLAGAAKALTVHHSTVFRRIGTIEARLGVRLFERHREGYAMTPAGEQIRRLAARMDEEVAGLERRLLGRDMRLSGSVRVTTTDTLLLMLLTPILAAFREDQPEIELEVAVSNTFFSLSKREADIAIRPTSSPPEGLVGRRVARVATAVYASEAYLARSAARDDLAEHDWIEPDDSLQHLPATRWLRSWRSEGFARYRVNTLLGMREAAITGMGLAALPCFIADGVPTLRRVRPPLEELATDLWLLIHRDLRRVARMRAFLDFVALELTKRRDLLEGKSKAE